MMRGGKPYTNENGCVDDELMSDVNPDDASRIHEWISENIVPARRECAYSSYGLKHIAEHDTRIYLTNNQFKDAMLIAGYKPIDENDLNWCYRIKVCRHSQTVYTDWRGWKYQVRTNANGDRWTPYYQKPDETGWRIYGRFHWYSNKNDAEAALETYAIAHGWRRLDDI